MERAGGSPRPKPPRSSAHGASAQSPSAPPLPRPRFGSPRLAAMGRARSQLQGHLAAAGHRVGRVGAAANLGAGAGRRLLRDRGRRRDALHPVPQEPHRRSRVRHRARRGHRGDGVGARDRCAASRRPRSFRVGGVRSQLDAAPRRLAPLHRQFEGDHPGVRSEDGGAVVAGRRGRGSRHPLRRVGRILAESPRLRRHHHHPHRLRRSPGALPRGGV